MRQFGILLLCLCTCFSLSAQDTISVITSTDSIVPSVDSLEIVESSIAQPDSLGIKDFIPSFQQGKLTLKITELEQGASVPALFTGTIWLGEEPNTLLFENGVANLPYTPSYTGELLTIQTRFQNCSVRGCKTCTPQTHPNKEEIICVEEKRSHLMHLMLKQDNSARIQMVPLWWSVVPPLIAIILALLFRQVLLALFAGIFAGAWVINGMQFSPYGIFMSFFKVIDTYILGALNSSSHLSVVIFSVLIGGVVALISRNGGMAGIVQKLAPLAKGPKSTQFVAWLLGVAIFFDDYANTLIVGNTMRPMTDKYKISREKLAYIVDSTAAPIAAIAFITTWIGAELNYISDALPALTGLEDTPSAYSVFLSSLSYSFYSFFTLVFILFIIFSGRDYGAMFKAESRARTTGKVFDTEGESVSDEDMEELEPVEGAPLRWINGFLPILVVVGGTLLGLVDTGMESCFSALVDAGHKVAHNGWAEIWGSLHHLDPSGAAGTVRKMGILIGNSDSYAALLWASMSAIVVAVILTASQRIMTLSDSIETLVVGFKTMLPAVLILVLAWSLATTTESLSTAEYLTSALGDSISPYMVPVVVFVLAAVIAFSTGSSWSTMAILYPIAIPMVWSISQNAGLDLDTSMNLLYNVIAVVLSASVLGDHCSPISDTTILSSLASNCNHIDHVKTQLPYALTVGAVSITMTYLSTALGLPFFVTFGVGCAILLAVVLLLGKRLPEVE